MNGAYATNESAKNALDMAIDDTAAENPELEDASIAWDMVVAVATMSTREVAKELCTRELGFVPRAVDVVHTGLSSEDE